MTIPPFQFQRAYTPDIVKKLLQITAAVTIGCVVLEPWLHLIQYFSLNPLFFSSFYFWQPVTSLFLLPAQSFTFGFMIDFAFAMLVFWLFGSILYERIGKKRFLIVYFASGLLAAMAALFVMREFQIFYLTSSLMPMILALLTLWAMVDPYQQILLFFVFPLKAKWVLVFALFATLFVNLVQQDIVSFAAYLASFIFAYFYGIMALGFRSPFDWMLGIDSVFQKIGSKFSSFWQWNVLGWVRKRRQREDAFVDSALDKISKEGNSSLGIFTRIRLKWVSFKRRFR